jgi:heme/copper-type cytochrome/quinol oxidase subunit 4
VDDLRQCLTTCLVADNSLPLHGIFSNYQIGCFFLRVILGVLSFNSNIISKHSKVCFMLIISLINYHAFYLMCYVLFVYMQSHSSSRWKRFC